MDTLRYPSRLVWVARVLCLVLGIVLLMTGNLVWGIVDTVAGLALLVIPFLGGGTRV